MPVHAHVSEKCRGHLPRECPPVVHAAVQPVVGCKVEGFVSIHDQGRLAVV